MSQKQAKRLRRMAEALEDQHGRLKELVCEMYGQDTRLSNLEHNLKGQDVRLKDLEGGLDGFQRYLLETKDNALIKAQADRRAEFRKVADAEQAARLWKAVSFGAVIAAAVIALAAATAVTARGENVQPEPVPTPDPPAIVQTVQAIQAAPAVPEENENERIEAALLACAHKIENCRVTYYDACVKCCGKADGITASGLQAVPYVTCAVDTGLIPLGADVLVDYGDGNLHYFRADDTGVTGGHIDVCVSSHSEALYLGVDRATVYWVEG